MARARRFGQDKQQNDGAEAAADRVEKGQVKTSNRRRRDGVSRPVLRGLMKEPALAIASCQKALEPGIAFHREEDDVDRNLLGSCFDGAVEELGALLGGHRCRSFRRRRTLCRQPVDQQDDIVGWGLEVGDGLTERDKEVGAVLRRHAFEAGDRLFEHPPVAAVEPSTAGALEHRLRRRR